MPHFSVSGLSSGIDFANMTTKLIGFARKPIDLMESKQEEYQNQLDTWNRIRSNISALENSVNSMSTLSDMNPMAGSFSNNNATDTRDVVSILSTGVAEEQDFNITVNKLAKNNRIMSNGLASGETLNQGTYSVTMDGVTTDFSIVLNGQNDTLEELRNSINSADIGITASVIDDGSSDDQFRLVLTADEVGSKNEITTQYNAEAFEVMGNLVISGAVLDDFEELQAAQDAEIIFGGQTITRTSNTISDLIDDTTFQIRNAGSGTISFDRNSSSLREKIVNFVEVHNETKLFIEKQINYNEQTEEKGILFGDSTLLNVISTFNAFTSDAITGLTGSYVSLPDIGITTSKEGTLIIDNAMLDESLADDLEAVAEIFVASGSSSNSLVTFTDHTRETASGTFTVYFTGTDGSSNVEGYFEDSSGATYEATGSGRFLTGTSGGASGLIVRVDEDATSGGSIGDITLSLGVAEKFSTNIYDLNIFDGRFYTKTSNLKELIDENAVKIQYQLDLLDRREQELKRKFADLEGVIGAMQSQSEFLTGQLDRLTTSYIRK